MQLTEYLKQSPLYLDGGMGTLLQARGLRAGEPSESWNLTHPDEIVAIHQAYFDAGSNVVAANTFGANALKYTDDELERIISAAVDNAKRARAQSKAPQPKWIALDIGPTGRLLSPFGNLDFEDAVAAFQKTAALGAKHGVDLILIETMSDSLETKAAVLAAKAACSLPVFVSNAYGENGRLMTGATPQIMVSMLEGLGVDAIGVNCSFGPKQLGGVAQEYLKYATLPVLLKPNAGLPKIIDGRSVYTVSPDAFADDVCTLMEQGVRLSGGCCGTTPDHIKALVEQSKGRSIPATSPKDDTVITSRTKAFVFGEKPILIGRWIDPTHSDEFHEALREGDLDTLIDEGIAQQDEGVHALHVNVSLPDIDKKALLTDAVCELQTVTDLPLLLDSTDTLALESALRRYNGKALVGPVAGDEKGLRAILPLIKKHGSAALIRTENESCVPEAAEDRVRAAQRIAALASELSLSKKDLVFMPSKRECCDEAALLAVKLLSSSGYKTLLRLFKKDGGSLLTRALECGLSAAIIDPYCEEMQQAYHDFLEQSNKNGG